MFSKIFNLKRVTQNYISTFKHFTLAILSAFIVVVITIYFTIEHIYIKIGFNLIFFKLQYIFIVATFIFSAVELIKKRLSKIIYFAILTFIAVALCSFYLTFPDSTAEWFVPTFRTFFLSTLFFISILWSPWLFKKSGNFEYCGYAKSVIVSLLFTILFIFVAILGVNGALFAIEKLFSIHIKGYIFLSIDISIIGLFGVSYFLSQLPIEPTKISPNYTVAKTEIFFTKYILTPLAIVYFLILYLYTFKIIVTQVWPKSLLSWLIIIFSIVAIATYLFWTYVGSKKESLFRRLIWLAIGLQSVMLFVTIGFRISAYSWTENRYMVVVFGVWLFLNSIYFLLFKEAKIKIIFISMSALILISQVGPLNVYTISKNSQSKRFKSFMEELKLIKKDKEPPKKLQREISSTLNYLCSHYNIEPIKKIIPDIVAKYRVDFAKTDSFCSYEFKKFVTKELGIEFETKEDYNYKFYSYTLINNKKFIKTKGYSYVILVKSNPHLNEFYHKEINTYIKIENSKLAVVKEKKRYIFDLDKLLNRLKKKYKKSNSNIDKKDLILKNSSKITLMINSIYIDIQNGKKTYTINAIVLIK